MITKGVKGLKFIVRIDRKVRLALAAQLGVIENNFSITSKRSKDVLKFCFSEHTVTKIGRRVYLVELYGIEILSPDVEIYEDIYQRRLYRAFADNDFSWGTFKLKLQEEGSRRITMNHMKIENISCSVLKAA